MLVIYYPFGAGESARCNTSKKEKMREKTDWDKRYEKNDLPWDTGMPDQALINLVTGWPNISGKALDIGCGTGSNAIWLAEHGFEVTALDISTGAIALAKQRQVEHEVDICLLADDFLTCALDTGVFDLVFDRGCFHCLPGKNAQKRYVDKVAACLKPDGIWLSLIGNKDQPAGEKGPPRMSAIEICSAVEPDFEILSLKSALKPSPRQPKPLRFWHCLMKVRANHAE